MVPSIRVLQAPSGRLRGPVDAQLAGVFPLTARLAPIEVVAALGAGDLDDLLMIIRDRNFGLWFRKVVVSAAEAIRKVLVELVRGMLHFLIVRLFVPKRPGGATAGQQRRCRAGVAHHQGSIGARDGVARSCVPTTGIVARHRCPPSRRDWLIAGRSHRQGRSRHQAPQCDRLGRRAENASRRVDLQTITTMTRTFVSISDAPMP